MEPVSRDSLLRHPWRRLLFEFFIEPLRRLMQAPFRRRVLASVAMKDPRRAS